MKLVLDDKAKHRLVGIAVLLSIIVVFAPAVLKKSQQRFEETVSVSVRLPPKPSLPKVTVSQPKALFQATKVASVDIPKVDKTAAAIQELAQAKRLSHPQLAASSLMAIDTKREAGPQNSRSNQVRTAATQILPARKVIASVASAQPNKIKPDNAQEQISVIPKVELPVSTQQPSAATTNQTKPVSKSVLIPVAQRMPAQQVSSGNYGVQLASFVKQSNAIALVAKLKKQGYVVNYVRFRAPQSGVIYYKVVVGGLAERDQAQKIQKQLAHALQLNGFVVDQGTT